MSENINNGLDENLNIVPPTHWNNQSAVTTVEAWEAAADAASFAEAGFGSQQAETNDVMSRTPIGQWRVQSGADSVSTLVNSPNSDHDATAALPLRDKVDALRIQNTRNSHR